MFVNRITKTFKLIALAAGLLSAGSYAASIHLPMQDKSLYSQLETLMVVSNSTKMTKPYSLSYVNRQLNAIKNSHPEFYSKLKSKLHKYESNVDINGSINISAYSDSDLTMTEANELGNSDQSSGELLLSTQYQPTEWLAISAGGSALNSFEDTELYNTYVSFGFDSMQLDVGYRSYWMSPFQSRAMLNSNNAKQTLSAVLFNPIPLEFANISYEVFLRQMEQYENVRVNGEWVTGSPYILGTQMSFEPFSGLSIGLNRTFQFGGRGSSISASDIWNAFTDAVGSDNSAALDNCGVQEQTSCELGNQRASVTARYNFTSAIPFSIYGEYAGEDSASHSNLLLGNLAVSFGIFFPELTFDDVKAALTYEVTEYQNAWHSHGIYQEGYRIDGDSSGHWGTNYVAGPEQTAGLSQYVSLELVKHEHQIETELYYHQNKLAPGQNAFPVDYSDVYKLSIQYTNQNLKNWRYKVEVGQNYLGESTWSGSVKWEF